MSFSSYGYAAPSGAIASINTQQWARTARNLGVEYTVAGPDDLAITVATGDRTVKYGIGTAVGQGVMDVADATANTLQLAAPSSGHRWYVVGLRRDWASGTGATSFVDFGFSAVASEASAIAAVLAARQQTPGTGQDDHPLAAVQIVAGQTSPQAIRDLRCWHGSGGGLVAESTHVLGYLSRYGTIVHIDGVRWIRQRASGGALEWKSSINRQSVSLMTALGSISPGTAGDGGYLMQAGTQVNTTNSSGMSRINFSPAFPNGLLTVILQDGDEIIDRSIGRTLHYGVVAANKSYVDYSLLRDGAVRLPNLRHRVNLIAIGF